MKKLFFYLSVAMLAVAAASCQKEMVVADGEDGNVTLTIQTPEVATKAIADGMNVDIVHYEIYKNEERHKNSLTGTPLIKGTVPMDAKGASLTLNLLQGQEYVGLFWAQVDGQSYYDVTDLRDVKVAYPNETNSLTYANDEARAAFCQKKVFSTGRNVSVVLERPFAQINLGTTIADLTDDYTITLEQSSMTVKGVANTFNVAAMTAGKTANNVVFSLATVPYAFNPSETLTANNKTWAYAGMNYVLVPNDAATVDVTYSIKTDVGTVSRQVPTVPVQKNHRTNLLGNLLTQETAIEIIVDEKFNTPDLEPAPIYMAAANGGEFTLTEDIALPEPLVIQSSLVLNLNGHTISGGSYVGSGKDMSAISVDNGATLTIDGEGAIQGAQYGVYAYNGNLIVKNGNISANSSAVQVRVANVNIEGGVFSVTNNENNANYLINCIDSYWKNGTAKVSITGGSFVGFNPENNAAEGVGTNFCAEGYKAVEKSGAWHVVADKTDVVVLTTADLTAALTAAVTAGNTSVVLDANGAEFDMNGAITKANVPAGTTVTIRNANVNARSYGNKLEGTVIYENCTFNNANGAYSIHFDGGNGHVVFKNCDLYGWNSFGKIGSVTFENCTLNGNGTYALIRSYTDMTLTDCTINLSNAIHDDEWPEGVEAVEGGTLTEENVVYVVDNIETLQTVLDNATADIHVAFNNDLVGNATVSQNKTMTVVIDGKDKKFDGTIFVYGNSFEAEKPLTIKNVKFESDTVTDFIHSDAKALGLDNGKVRYANIYVENCSFVGTATDAVAIRTREAYKVTVKNCVATLDHSFLQAQSNRGITIENVKVTANRGFNLANSNTTATFTNCEINATKADGYGIRFDQGNALNVTGCKITAYEPIVFRACTSACQFNLSSSELNPTGDYHVVVASGSNPSMDGVTGLNVKTL